MADVIAEGKEISHVLSEAYDAVKENAGEYLRAGQEMGEELLEKGKDIRRIIHVKGVCGFKLLLMLQ
jgi:hypothetical protein